MNQVWRGFRTGVLLAGHQGHSQEWLPSTLLSQHFIAEAERIRMASRLKVWEAGFSTRFTSDCTLRDGAGGALPGGEGGRSVAFRSLRGLGAFPGGRAMLQMTCLHARALQRVG